VQKAGQVTKNKIKNANITVTTSGKAVQKPASGFEIKRTKILNHTTALLKLNLPDCK
jgi:hypothetical protein